MSRTNLPNSKQFQRLNGYLQTIAGALVSQMDTSTWEGIQKIVEMGLAPKYFPVGTQLVVNHSKYGDMVFDVVAHDYLKSTTDENAHTMTILSHDTLPDAMRFDQPEAFYYTDVLNPGTYNFTLAYDCYDWKKGTYSFTVDSYQEGVQLAIARLSNEGLTTAKITAHPVGNSYETYRVDIRSGKEGTDLGTLGVGNLNHPQRVYAGSNNYAASAVRQFLNSSAPVGEVWNRCTNFDRPPVWSNSLAGFTHGLGKDFLSVVGKVRLPCSTNNTYEQGYYEFEPNQWYTLDNDKFYLPSQMEIIGNFGSTTEDNSKRFPFYEGSMVADRIKYIHGTSTPASWMLRSTHLNSPSAVRRISEEGWLTYTEVPVNIAVACTIVGA